MMQSLVVALVVCAAAVYSVWVLLPAGLRGSAAARLARWATRCGMPEQSTGRLQSTLAKAGTCSECSQCKGCAAGKPRQPRP